MKNTINFSELTMHYLFGHFNIDMLCQKYGTTKSCVVKSVLRFLQQFPDSTYTPTIRSKLHSELLNHFINFTNSREQFTKEYGISICYLTKIVSEAIQNKKLFPSVKEASNMYIKLTYGRALISIKDIPPRIVNYIGNLYISTGYTYSGIATIYGIHEKTVGDILKLGISENIFSDALAESVYKKFCSRKSAPKSAIESFDAAFEKRIQNK